MELDIRLRELHMARDGGSLHACGAGVRGFLGGVVFDGAQI